MVDKRNSNKDAEIDDSEEIIERLNPSPSNTDDLDSDLVDEEIPEVILIEEHETDENSVTANNEKLGKSFRSKNLSAEDLVRIESMPELEDQWTPAPEEVRGSSLSWMSRFIVLGCLLAISLGVWVYLSLREAESIKDEKTTETREIALLSEQADLEYAQKQANLLECVKNYLEAESIDERAKFSRKSESTARKMADFYKGDQLFDTYHFDEIVVSLEHKIEEKEVTLVSANVRRSNDEEKESLENKKLLLEEQDDGTYLVDWETSVIYQSADWSAFVASRSSQPQVFRLEVTESIDRGPYLYEFREDKHYEAYRIRIRGDEERLLLGYVRKDSETAEKMRRQVVRNKQRGREFSIITPMTLKLAYPPDAQSDQCVEITEVISNTWFIP